MSDRLTALAAARGMKPEELLAELVLEEEVAQRVDEVNKELDRLLASESVKRDRQARQRRLEETVESWMEV